MSFKDEARKKLFNGVELLANAVTTTLGPKGRNVAIQRSYGIPIVVHDGVTVAREVGSLDEFTMMGVELVRQAAQKTNDEAGDGTTTSTLLAYEIVKGGLELINKGSNPMVLRKQIYEKLPSILEELKELSVPVTDKRDIEKVALISSADLEIGKLVAEAVDHVGIDGLVTVEEGTTGDTRVEYTEGMEYSRGYQDPRFITNENRLEAVIDDPRYIIIDKSLSLNSEMLTLLNGVTKVSKNVVVIAKDIQGDALLTLVANKMRGNLNCVSTRAPGGGNEQLAYLSDMAIVTGATVLSDRTTIDITNPESWLGRSKSFVAGRERSVIVQGAGSEELIKERAEVLRKQIAGEKSVYEKEKLQGRLARMTKGVSVIKVGAKTEIDMREKIERVKDAIGAATAAREEGTVLGGGMALFMIGREMKENTLGEKLLKKVLTSPVMKLLENAGNSESEARDVAGQLQNVVIGLGYNQQDNSICNLRDQGIIDPTKVVRLSLENAISVGTSILTTDVLIATHEDGNNG